MVERLDRPAVILTSLKLEEGIAEILYSVSSEAGRVVLIVEFIIFF